MSTTNNYSTIAISHKQWTLVEDDKVTKGQYMYIIIPRPQEITSPFKCLRRTLYCYKVKEVIVLTRGHTKSLYYIWQTSHIEGVDQRSHIPGWRGVHHSCSPTESICPWLTPRYKIASVGLIQHRAQHRTGASFQQLPISVTWKRLTS